ncbi:hypothetical protein ACFYXF_29440 [Streptomyces sp. NPDC002680]|uniref:hypothetical protein n=1 Tax=Streptomyces sp. NPDC002680 TaxID=3364659 RepID=UPI0036B5A33D
MPRFDADLGAAEAALDQLPVQQEPGLVWSPSGREAIVQAFARTVADAKTGIFAGIWDHVAVYGHRTLTGPHT